MTRPDTESFPTRPGTKSFPTRPGTKSFPTRPGTTSFPARPGDHGAAAHAVWRERLHDLAATVAAELERGAVGAAWARTRGLEREADPATIAAPATPVPPAAVVGRRFAAAHRRVLAAADPGGRDRRHPAA